MIRLFTFILLSLVVSSAFSQSKIDLKPYWNNGLYLQSSDKNFSVKFGGRIQYDVMFIKQDDSLNQHFEAANGTEFRRARLYTSGTVYGNIKYKFQIDFAANAVVIKDAYLRFTKIPGVGNITVGNFKEPRGFEMISSSNFVTFMERSLTNQFDNDRSLGLMLNNGYINNRLTLFAGYFFPSGNNAKYSGKRYNIAGRIAGLPIYNTDNGYKVLHLGGGFTHEEYNNEEASYAARPEAHLAPKYLKVNFDETSHINEYDAEVIIIYNSFSFASEYTHGDVSMGPNSALLKDKYGFYSFFGAVSWFITGEHKNYSKTKSAFDRIKPKRNFRQDGGFGAIELALRYSVLSLNQEDVHGGRMNNITAGVNWYLNPITKITFNYVNSVINELGTSNIFQMRFQITF